MLMPIFVSLFVFLSVDCQKATEPKFIIDNDAGGDDAMAIFLALLYEKHFDGPKLVALTTGNGNTKEDNVYYNNQRILRVANRQDVPIYRGSRKSLVKTPTVTDYYGKDGLGDTGITFPDLVPAKDDNAVLALIEHSRKYKGELTVITIGTLTNVALAVRLDPGFLGRLKHLYIGAGNIQSDGHPDPEFNAHMDVEAYHVIAQNATADKVTLLPFSQVKDHLNFTKEWRNNVLGGLGTEIMRHQNKFEKVAIDNEDSWQALDPAVVTLFLRPDLVQEYKYSKNDISICGDGRGKVTNEFVNKENANVRVAYSIKTEEYKQHLLEVFKYDAS
ncbi:unnamed protein product [Arctia plantaginis]|uniref:Inosine/uridine-preferring nucleoside hydrolase domain-containing protein n=1 Tax=Arctia plantaginis TaxID=874455 RepID=A0A8S1AK64_ARCPL|nr:unnamed protein product [Arctia plantaginis]